MKTHKTEPAGSVLFWVTSLSLMVAPLIRGGNRASSLLVTELLAAIALGALAWIYARQRTSPQISWALTLPGLALLAYPLMQMAPLPPTWWPLLPGRAFYREALVGIDAASADSWRAVSLNTGATEYAWLAMLPCIAVVLAVQEMNRRNIWLLARLFLLVALVESFLGVLQVGAGPASFLYFGNTFGGGDATGTFVNKNHLAGLIAMALPLAVMVCALELRAPGSRVHDRARVQARTADSRVAIRITWFFAVALLLLALFLTRSRGGIGTGLLTLAMVAILLFQSTSSRFSRYVILLSAVLLLGVAVAVGLAPMAESLKGDSLSLAWTGRVDIARDARAAAAEFFPWGSGLGTFSDIFPRFQSQAVPGFVEHAHNDYIEAYVELGLVGVVSIAILLGCYLHRWIRLARAVPVDTFDFLQRGAGLGLLALMLHGLVDFNFHIPANALYFSFLAGIFIRRNARAKGADSGQYQSVTQSSRPSRPLSASVNTL